MSGKPLVEIIVHCYAESVPIYASLLTCQLSSLLLAPPQACRVRVTVCATPSDVLALTVTKAFALLFDVQRDAELTLIDRMYRKSDLFRRAIGRNDAAKQSKADVVWFADADYLFGQGCLDVLASLSLGGLTFPREVQIHATHADGDAEIALVQPGRLHEVDLSKFIPHRVRYAIGGLQIVPGNVARLGYLDGMRWTQPVSESEGFRNTIEDPAYRKSLGGSQPIGLPNLYRMRHSLSAFEPPRGVSPHA